jgi:hypothetical protein
MKQFIFLFVLIFSGFLFSQDRNAEFIGGEKQLKKLIYSKLILILLEMKIRVELIFKIDKKGKVKNIDCKSFYPEAKTEFLKAAKQINQKWKPAIKNGKVDSEVVVSFPVVFE